VCSLVQSIVSCYCSLVQLRVVCSLVVLIVGSRLDTFEAERNAETSEHGPGMCSPSKFHEGAEERGSTCACKFP
jgi:hypothetical protein